jgi:hypothetical protein
MRRSRSALLRRAAPRAAGERSRRRATGSTGSDKGILPWVSWRTNMEQRLGFGKKLSTLPAGHNKTQTASGRKLENPVPDHSGISTAPARGRRPSSRLRKKEPTDWRAYTGYLLCRGYLTKRRDSAHGYSLRDVSKYRPRFQMLILIKDYLVVNTRRMVRTFLLVYCAVFFYPLIFAIAAGSAGSTLIKSRTDNGILSIRNYVQSQDYTGKSFEIVRLPDASTWNLYLFPTRQIRFAASIA